MNRAGPRRHLWIDASAGIAGDMLLAALIDAGADLAAIALAIDEVVPGSVRLDRTQVIRCGQRATKIDVAVLVDDPPHRTWRTIETLLSAGDLDPWVAERASAVFRRLADAEGQVHGINPTEVHFHEVGALDSLADVVGVCAGLHNLGVTSVSSGEIALGSGRVRTAHGDIPVPVPAVAELARGWRVSAGGTGELTTPTGMALIASLAESYEDLPAVTVETIGVGAGTKDTPGRANVTRVVIGDPSPTPVAVGDGDGGGEDALVLEANVDDLDPRLWPGVLNRLLQAGAADAWLVPILMKKGRPAHTLCTLCRPSQSVDLRRLIFLETSTFGVRERPVRKYALRRSWVDVDVAGVPVSVKIAHRGGTIIQVTPEFESVASAAADQSRPARMVLDEAVAAALQAGVIAGGPVPVGSRPDLDPAISDQP